MQVSGRAIIFVVLVVALAMSAGAWWSRYNESRQAAKVWGSQSARLLVNAPAVELIRLGDRRGSEVGGAEIIAGREATEVRQLSGKPGLVHLRAVFTQDSNFDWASLVRPAPAEALERPWAYALRFIEGDARLTVLLDGAFSALMKLERPGEPAATVDFDHAKPVGAAIRSYLTDVGVLGEPDAATQPAPDGAAADPR
jgi:hypothetical protein